MDPIDLGSALSLWAESPEEARSFLGLAERYGFQRPDRIFVAKRSARTRGNRYIEGLYHPTTDDDAVDVYDDDVLAPPPLVDLVQWCTCDVMVSRGPDPLFVMEDTTHIVRMNLYQRFPRLARASSLGVPAVILQGTTGLDLGLRGDRWGLYRYLQGFEAIARAHPATPAVPIWFEPTEADEARAQEALFGYLRAIETKDRDTIESVQANTVQELRRIMADGVGGDVAPDIPSIDYSGEREVIVKVGARPERPSWRTKGSGQMDPYLGMILAAKYIYCFDSQGRKVKDLVLEFTYLPEGFWFFANPETTALYKRLPLEFADEVRFLG